MAHQYGPEDTFVKTRYLGRDGHVYKAYLNPHTGEGTDVHSDIEILVEWDDELVGFRQTDTWEWDWNRYKEVFEKVE